jgi:hypothetical protein
MERGEGPSSAAKQSQRSLAIELSRAVGRGGRRGKTTRLTNGGIDRRCYSPAEEDTGGTTHQRMEGKGGAARWPAGRGRGRRRDSSARRQREGRAARLTDEGRGRRDSPAKEGGGATHRRRGQRCDSPACRRREGTAARLTSEKRER